MIGLEMIRGMVEYNYATNAKVWDCVMTLSDEQFLTEVPYSHGSLRNHMVHLASVDSRWFKGLRGLPDARTFNYKPQEYTIPESVRALCDAAASNVKAYVDALDEETLAHNPFGFPVWQILLHIVNHGTDHRAQMLRVLHDLGAETFEQDAIFYFMKR